MAEVTVLPHPLVRALGGGRKRRDGGMKRLIDEGGLVVPLGFEDAFRRRYQTDAHFVQYALWTDDGPFKRSLRIKHGSLDCIENETPFHVRASLLALDIDLQKDDDGNKKGWGEGEYEQWLASTRARADEAAAATIYKTAHGARLVWPLKHDFVLLNDTVRVWRRCYQLFMAKLGAIGPNGEEPDKVCADYTRLFRLPNVLRDEVEQEGEISWCIEPLDLQYASQDVSRVSSTRAFTRTTEPKLEDPLTGKAMKRPKKAKTKPKAVEAEPDATSAAIPPAVAQPTSILEEAFEGLDPSLPRETVRTVGQSTPQQPLSEVSLEELGDQLVEAAARRGDELLDAMEADPVLVWARQNPERVPYELWRAIGTNYYACGETVPDRGKSRFHALSALDEGRYDEHNVDRYWETIEESSHEYGPVTYGRMQEAVGDELWTEIHGDDEEDWPLHRSSPAGNAYRTRTDPVLDLTRASAAGGAGGDDGDDEDSPRSGAPTKLKRGTETPAQVRARLSSKSVKDGDGTRQVLVTDQHNIVTIFAYDANFASLQHNLLGILDEYRGVPLTDQRVVGIRLYIYETYGLNYSYDEVYRFVRWFCSLRAYHPVADYLDSLVWDGVDRLDDLLDCLGLSGDVYARNILRRWLISAVVRPLNYYVMSGTKVDTVLVLKGMQGALKSTFFRALLPNANWFSDGMPSIEHAPKDASTYVLGAWIIECAEFDGHVSRSSVETLKAFVTRAVERFRPAYGRSEIVVPRPSVLVGTTNSETFLHDPTGDRRFWVLSVKKCEVSRVHQLRDQLWAQAVAAYRNGVQWWLTDAEDLTRQTRNQPFRHNDPVEHYINVWMTKKRTPPNDFTTEDVLQEAFGKNRGDATRGLLTGIGAVLARKGYKTTQVRGPNGVRIRRYRHPDLQRLRLVSEEPDSDLPAGG